MTYRELDLAVARGTKPEEKWDDDEWVAEEKFDGWRFAQHFGSDLPRVFMTGRHESVDNGLKSERGLNVPQLWSRRSDLLYTVVDGEVLPPLGADYRDLNSMFGKTSPEKAAEAIQKLGVPRYVLFDVLFHDGEDVRGLSLYERRLILENLHPTLGNPAIELTPQVGGADKRRLYDEVSRRGGEGVILKNLMAEYGDRRAWVKVKKTYLLDVVVTGFQDARFGKGGRHWRDGRPLVGSILISVYLADGRLIEIGKVNAPEDEVREHMTARPEEWIGTVIEVECARMADERLWHPRYSRRRDDASPRHCTYLKMLHDLGRRSEEPRGTEQMDLFGR